MKILYLANAKSIHTQKWVKHFLRTGNEVRMVSLESFSIPGATICSPKTKWEYFLNIRKVKEFISSFKPDIVHAHYATSYGLLAVLADFHPLVISVWGSDIFDFPKKSFINRKLVEFNLEKADYICSTSRIMAKETKRYTNKNILITPFGVDCDKFKPMPELKPKDKIVIGTVKSLEEKYGIKYLISAFSVLVNKYPELPLELHMGGEGSQSECLEKMAKDLNLRKRVKFLGYVANEDVPKVFNTFSVSVVPSVADSESFGVAVLEASACGVPVVVSDIGGLPEVAKDNLTGFIVPPRNSESIAEAVEKLILDENLRKKMGENGREFVLEKYEWGKTAKVMEDLYKGIIDSKKYGK